jgi:hypothetical protein
MNGLMPYQRRGMRVEIVQHERDGVSSSTRILPGLPAPTV